VSNENELNAEQIEQSLPTRWLGRPCHYLSQTTSTNAVLGELAAAGAAAGTVVLADFQTAGRGRHGRRWEAPAGTSLLLSLLFRPPWPAEQTVWLMMMAGIAMVEAVRRETGLPAALKWPNDVMLPLAGHWHKTGGLLLETAFAGGAIEHAITGIGLNVNVRAGQLPQTATPATSLLAASGKPVARLSLLMEVLERLEALYEAAATGQSPQPAWDALLLTRGRPVTVQGAGLLVEGTAIGTDGRGQLLIKDEMGMVHVVAAGDVTLRGEPE
jgi:BirA family transcriptional regulator, biotin operon repressor / biotin---[acetyl-CoA-carboxylase] ligase